MTDLPEPEYRALDSLQQAPPSIGDLVRYTGPTSDRALYQHTSIVLREPQDHDGHRYLCHDLEGLDRNTWQSLPQHLVAVARAGYRPAGVDRDVEATTLQQYVREINGEPHGRAYAGVGPDDGGDRGAYCPACSEAVQDYVWPCKRAGVSA